MNKQNHLLNQQKQNEQARQQIIQIKFLQLDTTITNTNINFRNNLNKTNKKPSLATNTLHSVLRCGHHYNCLNRYVL